MMIRRYLPYIVNLILLLAITIYVVDIARVWVREHTNFREQDQSEVYEATRKKLQAEDPDVKYLTWEEVQGMAKPSSENMKKDEERFNAAYNDAKKSYGIDDTNYTVIQYLKFDPNEFDNLERKFLIKIDHDLQFGISKASDKYSRIRNVGSLAPNILIRKDIKEVILLWKQSNGDNVIAKVQKNGADWDLVHDVKKGEPQLDIGDGE